MCPPQVRIKIEHFASRDALDIEGLGESVVDQSSQRVDFKLCRFIRLRRSSNHSFRENG